jgi:intein/homing endonuclease
MIKEIEVDYSQIESIELLGEMETIDICVEDTHMFFANDIYTHNSGYDNLAADAKNIGKAIEVFQVADYVIMYVQDKNMKAVDEAFALLLKNRLGISSKAIKVKIDNAKSVFTEMGRLMDLAEVSVLEQANTTIESIKSIRDKIRK